METPSASPLRKFWDFVCDKYTVRQRRQRETESRRSRTTRRLSLERLESREMLAADFGEIGMLSFEQANSDAWQTVQMSRDYIDPVVIAGPLSHNGSDPAMVRVRNVDAATDTFEVQIDEWLYLDGYHTTEAFSYLIVERGSHVLEDGTLLEAGTIQMNLDRDLGQEWFSPSFSTAFSDSPVVFSQLASHNGPDPAVLQQRGISAGGFQLKLREEEKRDNWHVEETVSWLAIEAGPGTNGGNTFLAGTTGKNVTHQFKSINLNDANGNPYFTAMPTFLASMQTTAGSDTANVRYRNLGNDGVQIQFDEETSKDKEIKHAAENVGYLFWEQLGQDPTILFGRSFVDLVAHRTGNQLGEVVTDAVEDAGNSADYIVLTNNDFDQNLWDGAPDFSDFTAVIPTGSATDDSDLAQITLKRPSHVSTDGSIELQLSHATAVRLFKSDGTLLYDFAATGGASLTLDLANPTGYLAGLINGDVDVWLEGLEAAQDFTLAIVQKDSSGNHIASDDIHINLAEVTFVSPTGEQIWVVPPIWKESLIALAESGLDMTGIALPDFFKMRVEGLAGNGPFQMSGQSDTYPEDQFQDTLVQVAPGIYESSHFIAMYSAKGVYGASPDTPLTSAERQLLLNQLNLNAIHNEEGTFTVRSTPGLDGVNHERTVKTREFVEIALSKDVANAGDTITATVTHASAEDDWDWTATLPDGSTEKKEGKTAQFTFDVDAAVDHVFKIHGFDFDTVLFAGSVSTSAFGSSRVRVLPMGEQMSQWELASWKALREDGRIGGVSGDAVQLNRVITENYAKLYNEAKGDAELDDAFQWAGMAAFASNAVGSALVTNSLNPFLPPFKSPVPGHDITFQDFRDEDPDVPDNASFANFDARWAWIANEDEGTPESMFDAWKDWNADHGDIDIQKLLDDEY